MDTKLDSKTDVMIPPTFYFQPRTGKLNWKMINQINIDSMINDTDITKLQSILQNLTFSAIDRDDLVKIPDTV
jgi:hypothetical protein